MPDIAQVFRLSTYLRYYRLTAWTVRWIVRLLSASIELYLRQNFGCRYLPMLVAACLFFILCVGFAPRPGALTGLFFLGMLGFTIRHVVVVCFRRSLGTQPPHTLSAGDSWQVWQRWQIPLATVQRYIEPAIAFLIGLVVLPFDSFLGFWLAAAAVALFLKEQLARFSATRHVLNAADARIEAQRLNAGLNQHFHRTPPIGQRPHRVRLARTPNRRP